MSCSKPHFSESSRESEEVWTHRHYFKCYIMIFFFGIASIRFSFLEPVLISPDIVPPVDVVHERIVTTEEKRNGKQLLRVTQQINYTVIDAPHRLLQTISDSQVPKHFDANDIAQAKQAVACSAVYRSAPAARCQYAQRHCQGGGKSRLNYTHMHFCNLSGRIWLSVPLLTLGVLVFFYLLAETAEEYFCPVVTLVSKMLRLAPSTAGVTLVAFGNGAPDVFASLAAFVDGNPKIGFGAIISAGAFVATFVVGCVALTAAPFPVPARAFSRDLLFYLTAAVLVLLVYMSGTVYLWQALGFVFYYLSFVALVVATDLQTGQSPRGDSHVHHHNAKYGGSPTLAETGGGQVDVFQPIKRQLSDDPSLQAYRLLHGGGGSGRILSPLRLKLLRIWVRIRLCLQGEWRPAGGWWQGSEGGGWGPRGWKLILFYLHLPFDVIRKATIPAVEESKWKLPYAAANIVCCPLVVLYASSSLLPTHTTLFGSKVPLWLLVLAHSSISALLFYGYHESMPPCNWKSKIGFKVSVMVAFGMSVFWISRVASELLGFLASLGIILQISPSILGLTVLAWGNSIGDLFADVALARGDQATMAIAGCFAGPLFNMLVGLGLALSIRTFDSYPIGYKLHYHPNVPIAFGFLFASLLGSLVAISGANFHVTRFWGVCLVMLYVSFMVVSLVVESGAIIDLPPNA